MVALLVTLLVYLLVFGLVWYIVGLLEAGLPLPHPVYLVARIFVVVLAILVILGLFTGHATLPVIRF